MWNFRSTALNYKDKLCQVTHFNVIKSLKNILEKLWEKIPAKLKKRRKICIIRQRAACTHPSHEESSVDLGGLVGLKLDFPAGGWGGGGGREDGLAALVKGAFLLWAVHPVAAVGGHHHHGVGARPLQRLLEEALRGRRRHWHHGGGVGGGGGGRRRRQFGVVARRLKHKTKRNLI